MWKILFFFFFITPLTWAYTVYNDEDYFVFKTPYWSYILTKPDAKYLPQLIEKSYKSMLLYESEFNWQLDERTSLIVPSNRNQIANAFATTIPNNMIVFYKGGVEFLDESASASWIQTLSSHEVAHVYQLNVKNQPGAQLKTVFGNQPMILIPFVSLPFFISPTQLLPTFLLEGNAVLNESRLNEGGRLFSGRSLTLATELANAGLIELPLMMNSNLAFPYGQEKYIVGGYFQSYLSTRFDFSVVNGFFKNHAENNVNPFDLKFSFAATFFSDYEVLYRNFIDTLKEKQKDYHSYSGDCITHSLQNIEFSRIDNSIYYLSVPDAKTQKKLNQYDIEKKELTNTPSHLISGKIFKIRDKLVTAANYSHNNRNTYYSLFDEDYNSEENYKNKYVTDIKGNFVSYFQITESFDRGSLYRNQEKIADTESKALLDNQGNIYYFRQEGPTKVLYKNSDRLTSIETHYALLTDIISENEIYFVSNSKYGSTLFCYCTSKIIRIFHYDNIVTAMKTPEGFLVSFQFKDSYRVAHLIANDPKIEDPFPIRTQFSEAYFKESTPFETTPAVPDLQPYFSLQEMRFSKYALNYLSSKKHYTIINAINWTDPLFYSTIDLVFSLSDKLSFNSVGFQYTPYATQLGLNITNQTDFYRNETEKITTNSFQFGLQNNIYEKKYQSVSAGADYLKEKNDVFDNEITTARLTYQYLENYFLNYLPYAYFSFSPFIERSRTRTSASFQAVFSKMIFTDFYFSARYSDIESEYFKLEADTGKKVFFKKGFHSPVYLAALYTYKLVQSDFEFLYEIPYSKYYYRFPVSLRRIAPYMGFQKNKSKEVFKNTDINEISFATIGIETELLFFHLNPIRLRLFSTDIVITDRNDNTLRTDTLNIQINSIF